ncbi:hypothetical protein L3X38_043727 [Prunus dulcis]|uniref:Alpha/beta hydrolase fold-3 domain-containing protein n=1 Tax=Prunus dulcis TaxID=3755 RepID=A0AAD4UZ20_PRUDU|nr:hypothetical protein L3X38_043727 [Prunus dulcis]
MTIASKPEPVGEESTAPAAGRVFISALWRLLTLRLVDPMNPFFNPGKGSKLGELGCVKVLVFVAEKDILKDRRLYYSEILRESGWKGVVELIEAIGEKHVFHLEDPTTVTMLWPWRKRLLLS